MIHTASNSDHKNTLKAILYSTLFSLALAFVLLILSVWILEKIPKSERLENTFVLAAQLLCGFIGGFVSSFSKQNCLLRAASTATLFSAAMLFLSLLFLDLPILPALLSALPVIPAGIAGGCINALRKPTKKNRKRKRK